MVAAALLPSSTSDIHKPMNNEELLPGTSFAGKNAKVQDGKTSEPEPESFNGPVINGKATTLILFSPLQLAKSPLLPALYTLINDAFRAGHEKSGTRVSRSRLLYEGQLNDELGDKPGTFTYVLCYSGTNDVIATASAKPHALDLSVAVGERSMWKRWVPIAEGKEAWELSTMAVAKDIQGQGLAGYLMKITEEGVRRCSLASSVPGKQLILVITTVKERNFGFYSRKGYTMDYEMFYDKGHIGAEVPFHVVFMSKNLDV
jgi:GNAT superfamily N-acetyltransferase